MENGGRRGSGRYVQAVHDDDDDDDELETILSFFIRKKTYKIKQKCYQ